MTDELCHKIQKFVKMFIEGMDADQLGQFMVDADLRQVELEMFMNYDPSIDDESMEVWNQHIDELQRLQDEVELQQLGRGLGDRED